MLIGICVGLFALICIRLFLCLFFITAYSPNKKAVNKPLRVKSFLFETYVGCIAETDMPIVQKALHIVG